MTPRFLFLVVLAALAANRCNRRPESSAQRLSTSANQHAFQVKGVVSSVKPGEKTVEIRHEEIPGYMPAMTMPFEVRDTNELAGLQPGDSVAFRMLVTDTDGW